MGKGRKDSIASAATVAATGGSDGGADAADGQPTVGGAALDGSSDATRSGEHVVKAPTDKPPAVGDMLGGRYELMDELGHGTSGVVFRARDWVADELVAIKVLVGRHGGGSTCAACAASCASRARSRTPAWSASTISSISAPTAWRCPWSWSKARHCSSACAARPR